jgi:carbon storage regulator CsrA
MLVLSRKCQEVVVIGGSAGFERVLKVTVLEIRPGRVRLGFDVEEDVPVHRGEVWTRINGARPPPSDKLCGKARGAARSEESGARS